MPPLAILSAIFLAGATVFYLLVIAAARAHARKSAPAQTTAPHIAVLKPLAGLDFELRENLQTFFELDYPAFELIFILRSNTDPAIRIVRLLEGEYPDVPSRLIVTGEPGAPANYPNAKVWSLIQAEEKSSQALLVIADSDIRAAPDLLHHVARDFSADSVGVVTYPYRAIGGPSVWSRLEALGMNTEFWGGVLVAQYLGPMDFAVGPTMAIRRECLTQLGGFDATRAYLAEDFVLGKWARELGWDVRLSQNTVAHHIGAQPFADNVRHRLRWYRSTRRSRPWGYLGQIFTYPLPFLAFLGFLIPGNWYLATAGAVLAARILAADAVSRGALAAPLLHRLPALLIQDALSFLTWLGAFWGNQIEWRNRRYKLDRNGRLRPAPTPTSVTSKPPHF